MTIRIKPLIWIAAAFFIVILVIPALLVLPFSNPPPVQREIKRISEITPPVIAIPSSVNTLPHSDIAVPVFRKELNKVTVIPLEEYVAGVVASEMPVNFQLEALKAQALAARTYIVRALEQQSVKGSSLPAGAVVTDTVMNQVYQDPKELQQEWGASYQTNIQKINRAIEETKGQILTYEGKPIFASFFSTSNGYTENSEDYWGNQYHYLKSVASPWDESSPKYMDTVQLPVRQVETKLGVQLAGNGEVGTVIKKTQGHKIGMISIDGKQFTGKEVREKLGLRSADFQMEKNGDLVTVTTKGFGHGVGMSQYGANGMAEQGKSYKDIVEYYYKDVSISSYKPLAAN